MTSPQKNHDGDEGDRLNRLYQMLARSRAQTLEIERRIAEEEGTSTEEFVQRRRRMMRGLTWIPAVSGTAALGRFAATHRRDIALVAGTATVTTAIAIGIAALGGSGPRQHRETTPPVAHPPVALPPARHTPPRSTPPRRTPRTTPSGDIPSPRPQSPAPRNPSTLKVGNPSSPAHLPTITVPPGAGSQLRTPIGKPARTCRVSVTLPPLRICLLPAPRP